MASYSNGGLPKWWTRPRPDIQPTLFPAAVDDVSLAELRVTIGDIQRWHQAGWLSFAIDDLDQLDWPQLAEITFVRCLLLSGLGETELRRLTHSLPRPLAFDSRQIAYSFEYGWVVPTKVDPNDVVETHLSTWLEGLASCRDINRLKMLLAEVAEHLEYLTGNGDESEESDAGDEE